MLFQEKLSEYVSEQKKGNSERKIPQRINITNLKGKCTDRMLKRHKDGNEIILLSHPGWNSRMIERNSIPGVDVARDKIKLPSELEKEINKMTLRRRLDSQKANLIYNDKPHLLREELVTEELLDIASERDIPVVLTVPCYEYTPLEDPKVSKNAQKRFNNRVSTGDFRKALDLLITSDTTRTHIMACDNLGTYYLDYIKSLINGRDNVYLLPTNSNRGVIITDVYGEEEYSDLAAKYLQNRIKTDYVDEKLKFSLIDNMFGSHNGAYSFNLNILGLVNNTLTSEDYSDLEKLCGNEFLEKIKTEFKMSAQSNISHWAELLTSSPVVSPLLEPMLCNEWENVYLAGGQIRGCLRGTAKYFATHMNPNFVFLGNYSFPGDDVHQFQIPDNRKNELFTMAREMLLDSKKSKQIKNKLTQVLFSAQIKSEHIESEINSMLNSIRNFSEIINPEGSFKFSHYRGKFGEGESFKVF